MAIYCVYKKHKTPYEGLDNHYMLCYNAFGVWSHSDEPGQRMASQYVVRTAAQAIQRFVP